MPDIHCCICKEDGSRKPIANLHWRGMWVHPQCVVALQAAWQSLSYDYGRVCAKLVASQSVK